MLESDDPGFLRRFLWHGVIRPGPRRWFYILLSLRFAQWDLGRFITLLDFWGYSISIRGYGDEAFASGVKGRS